MTEPVFDPTDALVNDLNLQTNLTGLRLQLEQGQALCRNLASQRDTWRLQHEVKQGRINACKKLIETYEAASFWQRLWGIGDLIMHLKAVL